MIGDAPLSASTKVPGWETVAEENQLMTLAANVPNEGLIVELGGEYGRSAAQFLLATNGKGVKVYTVDLFPKDHHLAGDLLSAQKRNLLEAIGVDAVTKRHIQVKGVSWEVGNKWDKGLIDLLFIDAGHDYDSVSKDIAAWIQHVKPDGVVVFHDYAIDENSHYLHHEVKRAVDEFSANYLGWRKQGQVDSLIWFNYIGGAKPVSSPTQELTYEPLEDDKPVVKSEPKPKGKPGRKPNSDKAKA